MNPSVRFNLFQQLTRQWDKLHPYNAAQALQLAGEPDVPAISKAWDAALAALGLGRVRIDKRRFHYETIPPGDSQFGVRELPPGTTLADHISQEMNRAFDNPDEPPFRPFVLRDNGSHYIGVVYHHWTADSVSIRLLMREWFMRLYDPAEASNTPAEIPPRGYARFYSLRRFTWLLTRGLSTSIGWAVRYRHAARLDASDDFHVTFLHRQLPDGSVDRLRAYAHRVNATFNDLLLAAIAEACDGNVLIRRKDKRQDLALGTIVDLRPLAREDMSRAFGLFLGFNSVICTPAELRNWDPLLTSISAQTRQQKENRMGLSSSLRLATALVAGKIFPRHEMMDFYRKRTPFAAGISNVNLRGSWCEKYCPSPIIDYLRVSPTGPIMPLVFTATTLGERFHLGLTYRPALVNDTRAGKIAESVANRLAEIADAANPAPLAALDNAMRK